MPTRSTCFHRVLRLGAMLGVSMLAYSQTTLRVGYAVQTATGGAPMPVASEIVTFTSSSGVVVSQAGVAATAPILSGRVFVDQAGTQTGIALANASAGDAALSFTIRNALGSEIATTHETLGAGRHLATYVSQMFPELPPGFMGSLTFASDRPLAPVTLREARNGRGEPLYATLPVADLGGAAPAAQLVFPQVAVGAGYTTQIVLLNTSRQRATGRVTFAGSNGLPLPVQSRGTVDSRFDYLIEPDGVFRAQFDSPAGLSAGYAVVTPDSGSGAVVGTAIFQFRRGDALVTEAGVATPRPTTAARVYVDGNGGYSGVALVSSAPSAVTATFTLLDVNGGVLSTATRQLAPAGHLAIFAHELFPEIPATFTGLIEIGCPTPLSAVTLRLTFNARDDQVLTTLPVADLNRPPAAADLVLPLIALGEGFSTRVIFINAERERQATGRLAFYQSSGAPLQLILGGRTASEFDYGMPGGAGRQLQPGNGAPLASLVFVEPATGTLATELSLRVGDSLRPFVRALDTAGEPRDDFELTYRSLDPETSPVDVSGLVQGKKAGFSTLTAVSGGLVATTTISVVTVTAGVGGLDVVGVTHDQARRLYLADSADHTILRADDLRRAPSVYAGVDRTPGLRDDLRLSAWFKNPSYLALNQSDGSLYVSDRSNHVIRRVLPGASGRVETFAGSGAAGDRDGPIAEARFNEPQGIALDNRGFLWVADTGNHTVRRIDLAARSVQTIAGTAGTSGAADGAGRAARFNAPVGIAVESEPLAQQLERERRGEPPPPIRVLVADTGNGLLRRVTETGDVETIRATAGPAARPLGGRRVAASAVAEPIVFKSPTGVTVDSFGTVYATEPDADRVRAVLPDGQVVAVTPRATFVRPRGIALGITGRIVVSDAERSFGEIAYAEPQITSLAPDRVSSLGGDGLTIQGINFAPGAVVVVSGVVVTNARLQNTRTLVLTTPPLPSGSGTVTVQTRGGLAQRLLVVEPPRLGALAPGQITTVAGGGTYAGDGSVATAARLTSPGGIAIDAAGNVFIADSEGNRVRKVSAQTGLITTVAGTGPIGFVGDQGPATAARLGSPPSVAVNTAGDVLISDKGNNRIRRVDAASGIITTVAGTGVAGFSGDSSEATSARLSGPGGVAVDASNNLFIADSGNHRIRRVDTRGAIITVAGSGEQGFSGEGGPATAARLDAPQWIAFDPGGSLFISDSGNHRIRKVDARGNIVTVAGSGVPGFGGDNGPAVQAQLRNPQGIACDVDGNLFIADADNRRVRRVDVGSGIITTVAGTGVIDFSGDNDLAIRASFRVPRSVAVDAAGNLLIADTLNDRVRRVAALTGVITTFAGGAVSLGDEDRTAIEARLLLPRSVAVDSAGNLYVTDAGNDRVRRIAASNGRVTTIAGTGLPGFSGDGGLATQALLRAPRGVAVDSLRNVYVTDTENYRVRKITVGTETITTYAGTGQAGYVGDGGQATAAQLRTPYGIVINRAGDVFFADRDNHAVRRIDASTRTITTVAGIGAEGFSGDGGPATAARLSQPYAVALAGSGDLLIADSSNHRIRKVSAETGTIVTVAGNGNAGFSGDGGLAIAARLASPRGVAVDSAGNVYFSDSDNNRIRKVAAATGVITTVGGGQFGFSGDGGSALSARFTLPYGLALDASGNLLIADCANHAIRVIRAPLP